MKAWQIIKPLEVVEITKNDILDSAGAAKVKLTTSLLTENDLSTFRGEGVTPLIPGKFGVGIISETGSNCFGLKKGDRVYINPLQICNHCYSCISNNVNNCENFLIAGDNVDGFIVDFGIYPCESLYTLPDTVSDKQAIFIEYVSLALKIIDELHIQKGDHVTIMGANLFGNIIAQLLIYYQAVPILVDDNDDFIKKAKDVGVYYTLNSDTNLLKNVNEITGGRLCNKVIHITNSGLPIKNTFMVASSGANIAFSGFDFKNIMLNYSPAMKKQLNIKAITNGYGNTASAINLLANKAVKLDVFITSEIKFQDVKSTLENLDKTSSETGLFQGIFVNLL